MWQYEYAGDELCHYGVLGMKWGVRRSREVRGANKTHKQRVKTIKKDSLSKQERNKNLDMENTRYRKELSTAKNKAANRLYPKQDPKTNAAVNSLSTGKAFVQTLLYKSSYGALKYNEAIANGKPHDRARAEAIIESYKDYATMTLYGNSKYLENRAARKQT